MKGSRNQTFTDPKLFGDGANGHGFGQIPSLFAVEDGARPAEFFALFPGAVDAHGDAFPDEVRSSSATAPRTVKIIRPTGVVVSSASDMETKSTHGPSVPASTARPARAYANAAYSSRC